MRKKLWVIGPVAIVAIAALVVIGGEIVMQLWNWLMPALFGWRTVTVWQAIGLLALCRILFGGLGTHGPRGPRLDLRRRMADRVADRWDRMTPEERDRFRQRMRERCGFDVSADPKTL